MYVRASSDPTGAGAAVGRQEADCRALAERRGYVVTGVFNDNDTSASTSKPRPAYRRLLAEVRSGRAEVIVCWHLDRLARRMVDLEEIIALNVPVATVTGDLDLSNDTGRLLARVLGSVAMGEVERKGARQTRANAEAARSGAPGGGPRPFGYARNRIVIVEKEAAAIREAYAALLAGTSLYRIAIDLNERGITTTAGNPWNAEAVRLVIMSSRYAGLRMYKGEIMAAPGQWPAIVEESTWRAAVELLQDPARRSVEPGRPRKYLLSGLATCGVCGARIRSAVKGERPTQYTCSASQHLAMAMGPVDEFVVALAVAHVAARAYDLLLDHQRPDVPGLRAEALALRARIDGLAALVADGTLSPAQVRASSETLRERLAAVEAGITDAGRVDVLGPLVAAAGVVPTPEPVGEDETEEARQARLAAITSATAARRAEVQQVWDGLDLQRRRAVIDALMTLRLSPPGRGARTFKPETVEITWKG